VIFVCCCRNFLNKFCKVKCEYKHQSDCIATHYSFVNNIIHLYLKVRSFCRERIILNWLTLHVFHSEKFLTCHSQRYVISRLDGLRNRAMTFSVKACSFCRDRTILYWLILHVFHSEKFLMFYSQIYAISRHRKSIEDINRWFSGL
jgi:hypothetical protein